MYKIADLPTNLADRIRDESCWLWTGSIKPNGYVQVSHQGRRVYLHRLTYEHLIGPIPTGLQLDHLCRNRGCCNPAHLEPVTARVNTLRSIGVTTDPAPDTCYRGHAYTAENTYTRASGKRICRECKRLHRCKTVKEHGTLTSYTYGCRCDACRERMRAYWRLDGQRRPPRPSRRKSTEEQ
jgi:hypothetical protein